MPGPAFYCWRQSAFAVTSQQGWLLTAWAAAGQLIQLFQLLRRRQQIALGLFVHDQRLLVARAFDGRFLTLRVAAAEIGTRIASRGTTTAGLAITTAARLAVTGTAASACAAGLTLTTALAVGATGRASTQTYAIAGARTGWRWGARTATAALWLVLNRADVVGTVAEVVDLVVEELVRRAVSRWRRNGAGLRLALAAFWARCALFACRLLAARLRGGLGLAGVLAFIFVAAAMAFATTTATWAVRVTRLARTPDRQHVPAARG